MKYVRTFILIFSILDSYGQSLFGIGWDVGLRNFGPRVELYSMNRFRVDTGLQLSRFETFSNHVGIKVSLKGVESRHNFWLGASYEHHYKAVSTFEEPGNVLLTYQINSLNYCSPKLGYSFKIKSTESSLRDRFGLFELSFQYDFLVGKHLNLVPSSNNYVVSTSRENIIKRYFDGGLGVYISAIYFIGGKKRE